MRGSIEEQVREIASNFIYPRICMQWADVVLNGNLRTKIKCLLFVVTHACTFYSLFHALAVMMMFG